MMLVQRFIREAGLTQDQPLFQQFDGHLARRAIERVTLDGRPIGYPTCLRLVHRMLSESLGVSEEQVAGLYGTQSLRSGGATRAASKVDFRLFQQHGCWHTASSAHRYILDTTDTRLTVTRALGY